MTASQETKEPKRVTIARSIPRYGSLFLRAVNLAERAPLAFVPFIKPTDEQLKRVVNLYEQVTAMEGGLTHRYDRAHDAAGKEVRPKVLRELDLGRATINIFELEGGQLGQTYQTVASVHRQAPVFGQVWTAEAEGWELQMRSISGNRPKTYGWLKARGFNNDVSQEPFNDTRRMSAHKVARVTDALELELHFPEPPIVPKIQPSPSS